MGNMFSARRILRRLFNRRKPADEAESHDLLVVRRGMSPAFYFFCTLFAKERGLVVVEDRRRKERRRRQRPTPATERRQYAERRSGSRNVKEDFWVVPGSRVEDGAAPGEASDTLDLSRLMA